MCAYFYGKNTTATNLPPQTNQPTAPSGVPDGESCLEGCRQEYRDCMRDSRGRGGDTSGCEQHFARCRERCRETPEPTPSPDPACPDGKGPDYEGCACGKGWATLTGKCPPGYVFVKKSDKSSYDLGYKDGAIGQCECQKWINENWDRKKGNLGEFNYPAGMEELMSLLLGRAKGTYGYDPASIEAMFGRGFENVRGMESGAQEQLKKGLASQGMLGTGTALDRSRDLSWSSENAITNLARDIMIKNEEQKRADTGLASQILGSGMGFEQLREAINAGRRGESNTALMLFLQLLSQLGG